VFKVQLAYKVQLAQAPLVLRELALLALQALQERQELASRGRRAYKAPLELLA
jgi:hypothetical protein